MLSSCFSCSDKSEDPRGGRATRNRSDFLREEYHPLTGAQRSHVRPGSSAKMQTERGRERERGREGERERKKCVVLPLVSRHVPWLLAKTNVEIGN